MPEEKPRSAIGSGELWEQTAGRRPEENFVPGTVSKEAGTARFEKLMREAGPAIYTLAVRLTGNTSDGDDLAQETFIKAYRSFARFRGDSEFSTWVYRICVNTWKNRVRSEKRRRFWKHLFLGARPEDEDAPPLELPADEPPVDHALEVSERRTALRRSLNQLDPADRSILVLRDMEDRPYEEIAGLLSLPMGTVKSRLARAREKLKKLLRQTWKENP